MAEPKITFTPPTNSQLLWLANPGTLVPPYIRDVLLAELLTSISAVVAGIVAGMMTNILAAWLQGSPAILLILAANIIISALRLTIICRILRAHRKGVTTPADLYLITGLLWCGLQGTLAFACLRSNIPALQILGTCTVMAVIGPICARNYAAPRYAMALCCLCDLPFVAGAIACGNGWLLLLVPMTPFYLMGTYATISRFQKLAIETLQARHDSQVQARQDPLTGLLNRNGMMDALKTFPHQKLPPLTLFHLDLDGFKQVNDVFGHQTGDDLLREVANRIMSGVRAGDIAARLGGDEFVVIAPEMPPPDAEAFAARLIKLVEAPYNLTQACAPRVGVSIGFACAPDDSSTLAELYKLADAALYQVKAGAKGSQRRATA